MSVAVRRNDVSKMRSLPIQAKPSLLTFSRLLTKERLLDAIGSIVRARDIDAASLGAKSHARNVSGASPLKYHESGAAPIQIRQQMLRERV